MMLRPPLGFITICILLTQLAHSQAWCQVESTNGPALNSDASVSPEIPATGSGSGAGSGSSSGTSTSAGNDAKKSDVGAQVDRAFSQHYTSSYYSLFANTPVNDHDHLLMDVHQLSRIYSASSQLSDRGGSLGYVWAGVKPYYIENQVIVNPNALFLPRVSLSVTPHVVESFWHRDWDLSLGIIGNRYANLDALTLNPHLLCDSDSFFWGLGLFITRTYDDLFATDLSAGVHLSDKQKIAASFSFGRTIEDQGIEDTFHAFSFLYFFRVHKDIYFGPAIQLYRGELRYEDNYSLKVDVKL